MPPRMTQSNQATTASISAAFIAGIITRMRTILLCLVTAAGIFAQAPQIDWKTQQAETLARFQALVQIDSSVS